MGKKASLFNDGLARGLNPREAAIDAGYSRRYAAKVAARAAAKPAAPAESSPLPPPFESDAIDAPAVTVDWIVREARRTYDAAHEAGSLSTAVSCLNLIGKHLGASPSGEAGAEGAEVFIITGIEGAPGSDADD